MGLDITYYRKLRRVECGEYDTVGCDHAYIWINPDFPGRAGSLTDGCHEAEDTGHFRAGSYGGYNAWREALARLVGVTPRQVWDAPDRYADLPFVGLINFSDCEGAIGPEASAALARDFAEWEDRAAAAFDGWSLEVYRSWRAAFEAAADGGAVCFH
jgi:hypothetical protein